MNGHLGKKRLSDKRGLCKISWFQRSLRNRVRIDDINLEKLQYLLSVAFEVEHTLK
ncbi:hypothetical protein FHR92_002715 [Fontibacillus solani]|uniref:Uncharacterized protein n=1 Tax=Fontibacillus solani TaxID=1572857 RepID=A0A7W3SU64_9BACL|nr:hypothetical protein [Fontibacillus solani]